MNLLTEENLVRLKVGMYGGLLFFSFFVIIAVSVTQNKLDHCPLYLDAKGWGPESNCNYAVAMAVIFGLIYALFRLVTLVLLMLGKFSNDFVLFSDLFQLIFVAVDCVAFFLVFVSACILSAGINTTCNNFDCDVAFAKLDSSTVSRIHTAEAGAWISFILWLVLVVVGVFWLFRQGKLPFVSRSGSAGDGGTSGGAATSPSPQMDTPSASGDPKY